MKFRDSGIRDAGRIYKDRLLKLLGLLKGLSKKLKFEIKGILDIGMFTVYTTTCLEYAHEI